MEIENIPIRTLEIIDDDSSWSSLSDKEQKPQFQKNIPKKIKNQKEEILKSPESSNERMSKFHITYESTLNLQLIGTLIKITKKYLLIKTLKSSNIMKLDNILFYQNNNDIKIIGKIQDVIGSVEEPLYVIEYDNYLKNFKEELIPDLGIYINLKATDFFEKNEIEKMVDESGTDASYQNDKEYKDFDEDFSDDEKEILHKKSNRNDVLKKRDLEFLNENFSNQNFSLKKLMGKNNNFISRPFFNEGTYKREERKPIQNRHFLEKNKKSKNYIMQNPFSKNNNHKDIDFQDFKIKKKYF